MIDLRFHQTSDLAVAFGAAPYMAFRPYRQVAQLVDRGMIVAGDLVGQREIGRIEYARLGAKEPQQTRSFFGGQPGKGSVAERAIEQQDAWGGLVGAEADSRT